MSAHTNHQPTQAFVDALSTLEKDGDTDKIVACFADDAEVFALVDRRRHTGQDGVTSFWAEYRREFDKIESTFSNISVEGNLAVLEWTGKGTVAGDDAREISYDGCSILHFNDDGKITRFRTYYDSAAFVHVEADVS